MSLSGVYIQSDMTCTRLLCVSFDDLVVSKGDAAAHTLLHADVLQVSRVTVPLATGLGDHLIRVEKPEEALLEVLGATYATAVELHTRKTRRIICKY